MLPADEYLRLRERPLGRPSMYQRWRDLLFLHFSIEPESIQKLLPPGLTVDTYPNANGEERAWVGLVPFRMFGIRPRGFPAAPWISAFPETNVRTYVHHEGHGPGVWFFSLDAARWVACRIARGTYKLPYYHARMSTSRHGDRIRFEGRRKEISVADLEIEASIGGPVSPPNPGE